MSKKISQNCKENWLVLVVSFDLPNRCAPVLALNYHLSVMGEGGRGEGVVKPWEAKQTTQSSEKQEKGGDRRHQRFKQTNTSVRHFLTGITSSQVRPAHGTAVSSVVHTPNGLKKNNTAHPRHTPLALREVKPQTASSSSSSSAHFSANFNSRMPWLFLLHRLTLKKMPSPSSGTSTRSRLTVTFHYSADPNIQQNRPSKTALSPRPAILSPKAQQGAALTRFFRPKNFSCHTTTPLPPKIRLLQQIKT